MSYTYQPEQPRNSGTLYPGWNSSMQYPSYSTSMERDTSQWSNSTGTSNQAAWSPESGERSYILAGSSSVSPTSATNSPDYYSGNAQATVPGHSDESWSLYYNFVAPEDQRKDAYWELQDQYQPSDLMPQRRPAAKQKKTGREVYPCLEPGCTNSKPFKRTADLQRHHAQLHAAPDPSKQFYCDYQRCLRATEPLGRKDHYRDHLREYHGEDLPKRTKDSTPKSGGNSRGKSKSSGKGGAKQSQGRSGNRVNISDKWWRCGKCLERKMASDGWHCDKCNRRCEEERIEIRTRGQYQSSQINNIDNSNTLDQYSENEEEEDDDEVVKTETLSPTTSTSAPAYRSQYGQASSTPTRTIIPQSQTTNNCAYQCQNSWIYNSINNDWDACPNCQGSIGDTSAMVNNSLQANDIDTGAGNEISTYQVSYATNTPLNTNTTSTSNTWDPSSLTTSSSSYSNNGTASTATPISSEYKSNCEHCSNYMVWDGLKWSNCPTCCAPQTSDVQVSGGDGSGRRGGGREGEKEKKKSRRSSRWFG